MANTLPPLPPGFELDQDIPPLPEGFTLDGAEQPFRLEGLKSSKFVGDPREGVVSVAGNLLTKSAAGLAGIATGVGRGVVETGKALAEGARGEQSIPVQPDFGAAVDQSVDVINRVEEAGQEFFAPNTPAGQATAEAIGKGFEAAGTAIKFPLSAVPFTIAALREGGATGSEERQKFVSMPMSQYLGELAQDHGASPLLATLAHMGPDAILSATVFKGGKAAGKAPPPKLPTVGELKTQANALYKIVDDSGIRISDEAFQAAVQRITDDVLKQGARKSLTPKTIAALDELALEAKAGGLTLQKAEELRRVLNKAKQGVDADIASAARAVDQWDEFISGLTKKDLSIPESITLEGTTATRNASTGAEAIEYLESARQIWSRARKTERIERLIDKAALSAGNFSGSGFENALRTQFRALAKNDKQIRLFTKAEQTLIRRVAFGTKSGNIAQQLGRFATKNILNAAVVGGAGFALFGPAGAALPLVGSVARSLATRSTIRNANKVVELTTKGPGS